MMLSTMKLFDQIKETTSRNEKIEIIKKNKDNEVFTFCLKFLLDSNVTTGIAKKKYDSIKVPMLSSKINHDDLGTELIRILKYVKNFNTGRDADVKRVKTWCRDLNDDAQEFIKGMVTKSIKLGVDAKSVNAAIPDLIPTWDVQLGSSFDKLKLKNGERFYLSQKLNGNRASFRGGKLVSRQGKEYKGMDHIIKDLYSLGLQEHFVDGELIRKNIDHISDNENFRIGTGIINSDADKKEEISFVIFDVFPLSEIKNNKSQSKYADRKHEMMNMKTEIDVLGLKHIDIVEMVYEGTDQSKIGEWLEYAVNNDWEGLMLNKNTQYEFKRTTNLIKVKLFLTADLKIVGVEEGEGRLKDTLGAIIVQYKNNTVNVGSGFDDKTRKILWENRENIIGRVAEVKYKDVSKDKNTGLESLQFPVFVRMREIGKEPSYE